MYPLINRNIVPLFFDLATFLMLGQKFKIGEAISFFFFFFEEMKTPQFSSEIFWRLPDDNLKYEYRTTAWRLPDNCLTLLIQIMTRKKTKACLWDCPQFPAA